MIGATLSNYSIVRLLGEGGMGAVYLAKDLTLQREVAVKIISPELARNPELMNRFRVEAIAQARLNHPNIVSIYAFSQERDVYFIVMEYIEGKTLKALIKEGGHLKPDMALGVVSQILDALRYAHTLGVVHRDIKPANIFVTQEGRAKIGDFGIAKVQGLEGLTRVGATVGTPLYSSPEQILGRAVDGRADLYSLGVSLYEMVTGRPPFQSAAGSDYEIQRAHLEQSPPPICTFDPTLPSSLGRLILQAMAKAPEKRFPDAETFRKSVEEVSRSLSHSPLAPKREGGSRLVGNLVGSLRVPRLKKDLLSGFKAERLTSFAQNLRAGLRNLGTFRLFRDSKSSLLFLVIVLFFLLLLFLFVIGGGGERGETLGRGEAPKKPEREAPMVVSKTSSTPSSPGPAKLPSPGVQAPPGKREVAPPVVVEAKSVQPPSSEGESPFWGEMDRMMERGDYAKAIAAGLEAEAEGARSPRLYQRLARAYWQQGESRKAKEYLRRVIGSGETLVFPVAKIGEREEKIFGALSLSESSLVFHSRNGRSWTMGLSSLQDVSLEVFKKDNPLIEISDKERGYYRFQMVRNDKGLAKFIQACLKILRKREY